MYYLKYINKNINNLNCNKIVYFNFFIKQLYNNMSTYVFEPRTIIDVEPNLEPHTTIIEENNLWEMIEYYTKKAITKDYEKEAIDVKKYDIKKYDEWKIFMAHFSYAIPNKKAIKEIKEFANGEYILEVGSGLGLWSYLLKLNDVKVIPTDNDSSSFTCCRYYRFIDVEKINSISALEKYKPNILLMIWPDLSLMAYHTLLSYTGKKFIYIGEQEDGLSATNEFFHLLKRDWKLIKKIIIPRYYKDKVYFYERYN